MFQSHLSVLGTDAADELVPPHELQPRLMAEVAGHDFGVATQRERLCAHAVAALPGSSIGLVEARVVQSRNVYRMHVMNVMNGLIATVGQQAGAVGAQRVDHPGIEIAGGADGEPAGAR